MVLFELLAQVANRLSGGGRFEKTTGGPLRQGLVSDLGDVPQSHSGEILAEETSLRGKSERRLNLNINQKQWLYICK